jgi:DNA-directed RNA polymerase specialized sigma24 family protein
MPEPEALAETPYQPLFLTTHWSVVLAAKDTTSPGCSQALETLCRSYWYPLYAFVRSSGYSPHDAQDLTQGFFERLLAKEYLRVVDPEKGRFRTFLKMALKRFLVQKWERGKAAKRGGGEAALSFDTELAEQRFQSNPLHTLAPDVIYDRQWAFTLLGEATSRLEDEYAAAGKANDLKQLKPYLTEERGRIPYPHIAGALNTTEGAARVAVHRFRKRFRELFREVVAETVSEPGEVEQELRHVIEALSAS